ncbi:PREDICTED: phospholipid-metabolizing enzyme A-C1-like [Branchiostoma belcheri]|uniref:Phospholipid-metabolizing enzyme A-C1-like n=1 Tax=Branchiostoma belcheri TaxID=7741 RepID=A0A6P4ZLT9_BRABE|nr:PREDICTED: phospholipid-metabolizing enzyme A-C1-like [Branchiostoma belcheri]
MSSNDKMSLEAIYRHNEGVLSRCNNGDLLQFPRGRFAHWAVYVGGGHVVHRTGNNNDRGGILSSLSSKSPSGVILDKAEIREDSFWDVVGDTPAKINNYRDKTRVALSGPEIVERARKNVGEVGYNVLWKNCEHFATWCRYGEEYSKQANTAAAASVGVFFPLIIPFGIGWIVKRITDKNNYQRRPSWQERSEVYELTTMA